MPYYTNRKRSRKRVYNSPRRKARRSYSSKSRKRYKARPRQQTIKIELVQPSVQQQVSIGRKTAPALTSRKPRF